MKYILYALSLSLLFSSCEKDEEEINITIQEAGNEWPMAIMIESIRMVGYEPTNANGTYWDSSTNNADPFISIRKSDVMVYRSEVIVNADPNALYDMNQADFGSLPIIITRGESLEVRIDNSNSPTEFDYMDEFEIADAISFFDNGDGATEFINLKAVSRQGYVQLEMSGTIHY